MWRRLPTWFPNIKLVMLPLNPEEFTKLKNDGWLREVAFRTEPRVNKLEIKAFLEAVHGMEVEAVNTINYQGKKKMIIDKHGKPHFRRLSDWKKAYVIFKPPPAVKEAWQKEKQEQRQKQFDQWQQQRQKQQERHRAQMASLFPPMPKAAGKVPAAATPTTEQAEGKAPQHQDAAPAPIAADAASPAAAAAAAPPRAAASAATSAASVEVSPDSNPSASEPQPQSTTVEGGK